MQKDARPESGVYPAHLYLGMAYEREKQYAQAISEYQKARALEPDNLRARASLGCVYAAAGRRTEAVGIAANLIQFSKRRSVSAYSIACIYAELHDANEACVWLEKAYEDRADGLYNLKVNPRFDPVRSDPRFQDLLRRMNFPP